MKISDFLETLDRYKEDAQYYKIYCQKVSGENAERLREKYLSIRNMIDNLENKFNNIDINITEEDFKC